MWQIRQEQLEAFERALERDFAQRTADHVRHVFAGRAFDEETVRALVEEGIRKADRYAIATERDTMLLVDLMVVLGSDFDERDEHAQLAAILRDPAVPSDSRIDLIIETLRLRAAAATEESDDESDDE